MSGTPTVTQVSVCRTFNVMVGERKSDAEIVEALDSPIDRLSNLLESAMREAVQS